MIRIDESGMSFGPFDDSCIFWVEKSQLYNKVQNKEVKSVEFILAENNKLQFVEAKSSSPRPTLDNKIKFEDFINEIALKFLHSINLYYSGILRRHEEINDIPDKIKIMDNSQVSIRCILVIKGHEIEWLPPIQVALNRKMISISSIWNFEIAVMNDSMAEKSYKLINRDI
ncbi:MAG: hypothetical protein Q4C63_07520 [Eubacteriales bacterium]|nr:hypothetical protein [Eubacteriales bacterium]